MKVSKAKRKGRLFLVLLCGTIAFIIISIILVFKVHTVRSYAEDRSGGIAYASTLDAGVFSLYSSFDNMEWNEITARLNALAEKKLSARSNPELTELSKSLDELKLATTKNQAVPDRYALKNALIKIQEKSQQITNENRKNLAIATEKISDYWIYTYVFIAIACVLSILFSLSAYFIIRSGNQLVKLKRENRLLLNNSIDCIIVCDEKGRIQDFNKEAEKLFGYHASEVRKKDMSILYFKEDGVEIVNQVLTDRGRFTGEVLNKHKNGSAFTSYLSANILYDENRKIIGSMGISRDITQQKKLEDEFRHIVNNASDIIYTSDANGNFVYVNPGVEGILGYTSEELTGKSYQALIYSDSLKEVQEHYAGHFKNRKPESYFEFRVVKKDGSIIWVGQNIRTVFDPTNYKAITGFHGIVRNINDRKMVELELADSEKKYRDLFDNSSELIQSINTAGNFLYVNEAWKNTLGYSDEEIKSMKIQDIIHPESVQHCNALFQEVITASDAKERRTRYSIVTKSGEKRMVSSSINVKIRNGKAVSVQSFLRDITKQEETQRLLKKSEINFRQIAETIKDVFYLYNILDKKYEYISPNCIDVLGADQDFFYRGESHTAKFVHPDDKVKLKEANLLVDSGMPYEIEYRLIIDETISWINEKSFPIKDAAGQVTSNSGICRDVTNINLAKETISKQNIEIGKSIAYAKSIQDSSLPTTKEIAKIFSDSFVFYSPKDILSGDFYIFDAVKGNNNEPLTAFLVADCTGHGVPGGILSLLCNSLIKESFTTTNPYSPSEALDFVREKIIKFFRSSHTKRIQDGMDIALCVLNSEENKLYFSGANSSIIIIRNDELIEYSGDKQHVGYNVLQKPFTNHEIEVKQGDCIYLFTDGYSDQFGGESDKRFSKKRLKKLLLSVQEQPMSQQSKLLEHEFLEWKGENEQTDDVTLFGVRI